ncbi:MAG: gamma-glutamylcyclotransferase [Rhodoferax sp.]|nr:gamma-glutamylcyclotransferase [Rhodoferax sp.]
MSTAHPRSPTPPVPPRDPAAMLQTVRRAWGGQGDLWLFGYASLIWRPDFEPAEQRPARVPGWHRALRMWSRINRGTPDCPGLVFALLSGGCCRGVALKLPPGQTDALLEQIWAREMPLGVYDPRWLVCHTPQGPLRALAFTLSRRSPSYTGELSEAHYRQIFAQARGRYGSTLDYARDTLHGLRQHGIEDRALARLLGSQA